MQSHWKSLTCVHDDPSQVNWIGCATVGFLGGGPHCQHNPGEDCEQTAANESRLHGAYHLVDFAWVVSFVCLQLFYRHFTRFVSDSFFQHLKLVFPDLDVHASRLRLNENAVDASPLRAERSAILRDLRHGGSRS